MASRWSARPRSGRAKGWVLLLDGRDVGDLSLMVPLETPELTVSRVVSALNRDGES